MLPPDSCSFSPTKRCHSHGHKLLLALKTINTYTVTAFCRALPWAFILYTLLDQLKTSPERAPSLCFVLLLSAKDTFLLHLTTLHDFYLFIFPNSRWRFSTCLDILSFSFSIIPSKEIPGLISLQSKGLSRVSSNTTVQTHQFFGTQPSSQSNSHIHTWLLEKP